MYSNYIALSIFFLFSLFMPFSMIVASMLLRRRARSNPVSRSSYESAEKSFGSRISIMNEYIHYFSIFISFEVVAVITLLWALAAPQLDLMHNAIVISILIAAFIFELLIIRLARADV